MDVISSADHQALVTQFNASDDVTTLGFCVHHLFECTAERHPKNIAVVCANLEVTFQELNDFANRLARTLIKRGIQSGDRVVVAVDRSIHLMVALLGVLKAGAAYLPLDMAFPEERIRQIMDDADPKLVVTDKNLPHVLRPWKHQCVSIENAQETTVSDSSNLSITVQPEDLAYVIYTSGSTGRPKGVEMSHGAVSNYLLSMIREPGCGEADRLLAVSTVSFDMAVPELFMPLLCGGMTVIAQTQELRDTGALLDLIRNQKITIMQGTPAIWQLLLDSGWHGNPRLSKILTAGEALSMRLADRLLTCADSVWNLYGPTETSYTTVWKVTSGEDVVIGHPVANLRLYVLGADLSPLPLGRPGELFIGGAGVARGYLNNSKLTQSRFFKNPFHEGTMYKSGDLACFQAPGKLRVIGRIDSQVKIRGYRIELGDIEAAITEHEAISAAAVVSREDRLVAYCMRHSDARTSGPNSRALVTIDNTLRPWLTERLPAYMIPAFFVEMDTFPVTINGKVDRKRLPDPLTRIELRAEAKPANELESQVMAIWSNVLGHDRINVEDNFFQIGGDSVRIVRVKVQLDKLLGRSVSPAKLFEHYTVKALAAYLAGTEKGVPKHDSLFQAKIQAPKAINEDIAIVSMACRLPGDVNNPEDFWNLLISGGDATTDVPKDRWDAEALYDADPDASGKSYCRRGGFISSVHSFDAPFFGISPREARALDPMQKLMLETCWEGFERAGYTNEQLRGSQTGVFIGISNIAAYNQYAETKSLTDLDGYSVTGTAGSTMSGRLSYTFGLEGPALTVDTACSSSLVTTHMACAALRQRECDLAVSGGVSLMLTPALHVEFSRLRGMSPDGRCRAFSADTQGTGWGEGSAVVVLKRLSDAQRDGDKIHAVLRGTAVNHGGHNASLTTPNGPAQQRLVRAALATSALQPNDIDYVEAHGTGTRLGDPIEGVALSEVFGDSRSDARPLFIGSAKSNLGHTQATAGLVGVIKVVLAMQNSILPRTLHVSEPTPAVDWKSANMALVEKERPWVSEEKRVRRAGVSAFGIGGTNAHVIIEEPPKPKIESQSTQLLSLPTPVPFLLSGRTEKALADQAKSLRRYLIDHVNQDRLNDVAYTLATSRSHFKQRTALIANDRSELLGKLESLLPVGNSSGNSTLALLFTGQGSQTLGMGRELCKFYPVFRDSLFDIAGRFTGLEKPLLEVMWAKPESQEAILLHRTDFAQPALFALEVALWRLWQTWGVQPEAVLGHSIGELAAAHVAGVMCLDDACRLVEARGRLMQALPSRGKMVSLESNATEVIRAIELLALRDKVDVAAYNTPTQTVVSGDDDAVENVAAFFAGRGQKAKVLEVSHAFHSHHMDGMLEAFRVVAETVKFSSPQIRIISTLTGKPVEAGQLENPEYWVEQARGSVRFSSAIETLIQQGVNCFVELGPRPVLCGMGTACLADNRELMNATLWVPSLIPGKDEAAVVQHSVTRLHLRHISVNWQRYFEPFGCSRVELPTYAFQRECFRHALVVEESTTSVNSRTSSKTSGGWDLRKTLRDATPEKQGTIMLGIVRETLADALGLNSPSQVETDDPLENTGVDSLTASLMRAQLSALTGLNLPATVAFDHSNIQALSQFLLLQLEENGLDIVSDTASSSTSDEMSSSEVSRSNSGLFKDGSLSSSLTSDDAVVPAQKPSAPSAPPKPSSNASKEDTGTSSTAVAPLHRVLCPFLHLLPPGTPPHIFSSALSYFNSLHWCSRLINELPARPSPLPGYGKPIPFISQSFNPASSKHDQYVGRTLALAHSNGVVERSAGNTTNLPPITHMLSLFRPSDAAHVKDPTRYISRVMTLFALGDGTSGYEGILHGGLTSTLLDESLSIVHEINTALAKNDPIFASINVTASLNIRFLAPVPISEAAVCVTAWIESVEGHLTMMKAELTNSKGEKLAVAESVFAAMGLTA